MNDFCETIDKVSILMYDDENDAQDGGVIMTSKEMIHAALRAVESTQAEAAANVGWVPQQLSQKLVRGSLRADDFIDILNGLGIELTMTVRETGEVVKTHISGAGRRVRAMVGRVIFDTVTADALANNFYADGVNEYIDGKALELYVDREGRYFFAEYSNWEGVKDRITPVSAKDAVEFIKKYGTEIHKKPEN